MLRLSSPGMCFLVSFNHLVECTFATPTPGAYMICEYLCMSILPVRLVSFDVGSLRNRLSMYAGSIYGRIVKVLSRFVCFCISEFTSNTTPSEFLLVVDLQRNRVYAGCAPIPIFQSIKQCPGAMAKKETRRLQVAIPIYENMTMLDVVGPYEILNALPNVDVLFVSHKKGFFSDLGSFTMEAKASFDEIPSPDVVLVPGGLGTRGLVHDKPFLDWIRKAHETTLYTTSVCTGSLMLGAAGLLTGIDATTHWNALPMLADFGANPVSQRVVHQGKIITAAGVASGIDMAIALAALLTDELTAQGAQLFIEYDPQPPFNTGSLSKASPEVVAKARELADFHRAELVAKQQGKA